MLWGEEIRTFQGTAVASSSVKSRTKIPLFRLLDQHNEGPVIFQCVETIYPTAQSIVPEFLQL